MALATVRQAAIAWTTIDGGPANLFQCVALDFGVYREYTFSTAGSFQSVGARSADGVILDNLENPHFLNVSVNGSCERVPPFTKTLLRLWPKIQNVTLGADGGLASAHFFTGLYPAAPFAINVLGALLAAK